MKIFLITDDFEPVAPRVQTAPEVRPREKTSILDSILSKYGRPYAGISFTPTIKRKKGLKIILKLQAKSL